jgi:hypothetical protein
MPLRYVDALKILSAFTQPYKFWPDVHPINPMWLYEGTEPTQIDWPMLLPTPEQIGFRQSILFSDYVALNRELLVALVKADSETILPEAWLQPYLSYWLKLRWLETKLGVGSGLVEWLLRNSAERMATSSPEAKLCLARYNEAKNGVKSQLTSGSLKSNTAGVKSDKSEIEKLIEDVKRKAAKPGAKAELARELGVDPPRISEWLSGKKEPGGDYALRLRNWVYPSERKK